MLKKLKKLLKENNRIIATHDNADYNYISKKENITQNSYEVPVEKLTEKEIVYFINRIEKKNYTFQN